MTNASSPDTRTPCLVIGCKRSNNGKRGHLPDGGTLEYICGVHWRPVSKRTKAVLRRCRRRARTEGWTPLLIAISRKFWGKARTQAIEAAMGIG